MVDDRLCRQRRQSIRERGNDENGMILPVSIAPFEVIVVPVNAKEESQMKLAEEIYAKLKADGIDALLDDREERAGVKFKDADLIGIPLRIVVGKKCGEGIVEYKLRRGGDAEEKTVEEAVKAAEEYIKSER